jgi:hypothetical protein
MHVLLTHSQVPPRIRWLTVPALLLPPLRPAPNPPPPPTTRADPFVEVGLNEKGEHVLGAAGEVHLETCLKDLAERFARVQLQVRGRGGGGAGGGRASVVWNVCDSSIGVGGMVLRLGLCLMASELHLA